MPTYTKKLVVLHVPFVFFMLKKIHVNLSLLTNMYKSTRSKLTHNN